jgi:hypothetical protein
MQHVHLSDGREGFRSANAAQMPTHLLAAKPKP